MQSNQQIPTEFRKKLSKTYTFKLNARQEKYLLYRGDSLEVLETNNNIGAYLGELFQYCTRPYKADSLFLTVPRFLDFVAEHPAKLNFNYDKYIDWNADKEILYLESIKLGNVKNNLTFVKNEPKKRYEFQSADHDQWYSCFQYLKRFSVTQEGSHCLILPFDKYKEDFKKGAAYILLREDEKVLFEQPRIQNTIVHYSTLTADDIKTIRSIITKNPLINPPNIVAMPTTETTIIPAYPTPIATATTTTTTTTTTNSNQIDDAEQNDLNNFFENKDKDQKTLVWSSFGESSDIDTPEIQSQQSEEEFDYDQLLRLQDLTEPTSCYVQPEPNNFPFYLEQSAREPLIETETSKAQFDQEQSLVLPISAPQSNENINSQVIIPNFVEPSVTTNCSPHKRKFDEIRPENRESFSTPSQSSTTRVTTQESTINTLLQEFYNQKNYAKKTTCKFFLQNGFTIVRQTNEEVVILKLDMHINLPKPPPGASVVEMDKKYFDMLTRNDLTQLGIFSYRKNKLNDHVKCFINNTYHNLFNNAVYQNNFSFNIL